MPNISLIIRNDLKAYIALFLGIVALSLTAMFVRWADAPGTISGFYRLFFSSLILIPVMVIRGKNKFQITRSNIFYPVLGGIFTAFDFAFWNTSVFYTTASNSTLLGNTAPIWIGLVTIFVFRKKVPIGFWIGLFLALLGAGMVLGNDLMIHTYLGIGDLMAITAGFFYAGYLLTTQFGRRSMDPLSYMVVMVISASLFTLIINVFLGVPLFGYSTQSWIVFAIMAVVSQILGYVSITFALGRLPASLVSPTMIAQPILTTILAVPLLNELPQLFQIIGGLIAIAGIFLVHVSYNRNLHHII
jgi:drug/metabolite transporter (DMT)-like permease